MARMADSTGDRGGGVMSPSLLSKTRTGAPDDGVPDVADIARSLLAEAKISNDLDAPLGVNPLAGGRNNRVFCVTYRGISYLHKQYFKHAADPRNRLATEWAFAQLLWQGGLRNIPQPLAVSHVHDAALFAWVEGATPIDGDQCDQLLDDMLQFIVAIQSLRSAPDAKAIPNASEAGFSVNEHIALVQKRVDRLTAISLKTPLHRDLRQWSQDHLVPLWESERAKAKEGFLAADIDQNAKMLQRDWCLSPSDFGYHNTLLSAGKLVFLDFEYAGWDDPAKLVCDAFCQPQVPLPREAFDSFARAVAKAVLGDRALAKRIESERVRMHLLLPLYQIKWCCIILNEFLPVGQARRSHADAEATSSNRLRQQFDRAQTMCESMATPSR